MRRKASRKPVSLAPSPFAYISLFVFRQVRYTCPQENPGTAFHHLGFASHSYPDAFRQLFAVFFPFTLTASNANRLRPTSRLRTGVGVFLGQQATHYLTHSICSRGTPSRERSGISTLKGLRPNQLVYGSIWLREGRFELPIFTL